MAFMIVYLPPATAHLLWRKIGSPVNPRLLAENSGKNYEADIYLIVITRYLPRFGVSGDAVNLSLSVA
jgi:hypothetical protein